MHDVEKMGTENQHLSKKFIGWNVGVIGKEYIYALVETLVEIGAIKCTVDEFFEKVYTNFKKRQ